ncbi:phage tail protein [Escherichia coli]
MLGLGDFIFAISTVAYNKLQRSDAWRWAQQTRFGKNDALQITGRPNPTITIDGKINALFLDGCGVGLLTDLRALGKHGRTPAASAGDRGGERVLGAARTN